MKKFSPLKVFIFFLAIVFISHQLISTLYKPISTESAYFYTANNGFDITGVVIRNETLIKSSKDGVMHFLIDDGSRVAKDGVIANIYQNEDASITLTQLDSIKNKINDIEEIVSLNNVEAANLDVANANISKSLNDLILASSYGNFSDMTRNSESLLSATNRLQAILGETSDFSEQLKALKKEYNSLESSLSNPVGKVKSKESGYFLTKTDGYENVFDIDNLKEITPEFLKNLSKHETPNNIIGKIVSDYEWYIAANISLSQSLNFKAGDALSIHTGIKTAPYLDAKVKEINLSSDGTDAVIIFSCSNMNSELANLRTAAMSVVKQQYSGLRVPKKALRVVDSVRGVYVQNGMQIKFKPIEIIYSGDNYIICKKIDQDGALRLYDQVIVKGKNLYDGKIIS